MDAGDHLEIGGQREGQTAAQKAAGAGHENPHDVSSQAASPSLTGTGGFTLS
jgi:hypothetical protein